MKLSFIRSFTFWYIVLWVILVLFAYIPVYRNFQSVPSGQFFYGADDIAIDLTGNIATVRQGFEGEWFGYFNYTTQLPYAPSFLKFEYILLGKIARIIELDPSYAIMAARFFLMYGWFILLYVLVKTLFKTKSERLTAAMLVLFATSITFKDAYTFLYYSIPDTYVFQRFTLAQIHYLLGGLSGLASVYFLSQAIKGKRRPLFLCISCFCAVVSALTYGPTMVLILISFPVYLLLRIVTLLISHRTVKSIFFDIAAITIYSICTAGALFYVRWVVHTTWAPYQTFKLEMGNPFSVTPTDYLFAMGIVYLLSWLAIPIVLKKKDPLRMLLIPWILLHPVALLWLSPKLDLNTHRFFLIPYSVPFGLLATDGIRTITELLNLIRLKIPFRFISFGIVSVVFISGFYTYKYAWNRSLACYDCIEKFSNLAYPSQDLMKAIFWIRDHTQNHEVVLSQQMAGQLLAPFAGNQVYLSKWFQFIGTEKYPIALRNTDLFYRQVISQTDAYEFLQKSKISYVLLWDEERAVYQIQELTYPFLEEVYRTGNSKIYKVKEL